MYSVRKSFIAGKGVFSFHFDIEFLHLAQHYCPLLLSVKTGINQKGFELSSRLSSLLCNYKLFSNWYEVRNVKIKL